MNMPGLTKCNIAEIISILNFLYSTTSLTLFKFKIRQKPPSDFSRTNMGEINSRVSCFVSTITDLANKGLISAATNSCSFNMHSRYCNQNFWIRCKFLPLLQVELEGSTLKLLNSVLKAFFNDVKVSYLQCILEGNQCFFGFQLELS